MGMILYQHLLYGFSIRYLVCCCSSSSRPPPPAPIKGAGLMPDPWTSAQRERSCNNVAFDLYTVYMWILLFFFAPAARTIKGRHGGARLPTVLLLRPPNRE
jgi:hypothetical protein